MIYLHNFETTSEFEEQYNGEGYLEPWVSYTEENDKVNYNKKKYEPLTFKILSDGNIGWKIERGTTERTIQYSKNEGEWTDITSTTGGTAIQVVTGDVLRFKGETWPASSYSDCSRFTSTCTFAASGNPGSLKYGEVTYGDEPLETYCYCWLFLDCIGLTTAPELPATTLTDYCYNGMFYGCTSLTTAPALPATTLAESCYNGMFFDCTGLTTAPELPATTLAKNCYADMFVGCTSLTTAPSVLPATTLADSCYYYMFRDCTSLTTAPSVLPATTLVSNCYYSMFMGCTSLTSAPELPATTLVNKCYYTMFQGCTSLNYVKCLATNIPAPDASSPLRNWLSNVSSTGTFYKKSGVGWPRGTYGAHGIPAGWTVVEV